MVRRAGGVRTVESGRGFEPPSVSSWCNRDISPVTHSCARFWGRLSSHFPIPSQNPTTKGVAKSRRATSPTDCRASVNKMSATAYAGRFRYIAMRSATGRCGGSNVTPGGSYHHPFLYCTSATLMSIRCMQTKASGRRTRYGWPRNDIRPALQCTPQLRR